MVTQALAGNEIQSLTATGSNVAQSLAATASNVTLSLAAMASNVAQSLVVMVSHVAQSHSKIFTEANNEALLASFSPERISEDTATREMVLEMPPLTDQVIETLLVMFHPIICLQLLTILPFIHRWLQMILPLG
jgi:hypothetical protein